jgi:hypothetical protein
MMAMFSVAIFATAPSAIAQRVGATPSERGGVFRAADFQCLIHVGEFVVGAEKPLVNNQVLTGELHQFVVYFMVRNAGSVLGDVTEWSYTVTQNGNSLASVVHSGPVAINLTNLAFKHDSLAMDNYYGNTGTFSPRLQPGHNKIVANFTVRSPLTELDKTNNQCTFVFFVDYK